MKEKGHEFVCSDDKEGPGSVFQEHIVDVSVLFALAQASIDWICIRPKSSSQLLSTRDT